MIIDHRTRTLQVGARLCALGLLLTVAGCDAGSGAAAPAKASPPPAKQVKEAPTKAADPAPAKPAVREGPGWIDGELVGAAIMNKDTHKLKLTVNRDGNLRYMAVYHRDESKIPEAVLKAASAAFDGGEIQYYESEHYAELGRVFEVQYKTKDGRECEYSAKADGAHVYTECKLDPNDVPPDVMAGATGKLAGGVQIKEAEHTKRADGSEEYGLVFTYQDAELKYYVAPDGTVNRRERRIPAQISVPYVQR